MLSVDAALWTITIWLPVPSFGQPKPVSQVLRQLITSEPDDTVLRWLSPALPS